jgi:hypothetical protein
MSRLGWQLVGVLVLLALVWFHGMTKGKAWVQADWDAANVAAEHLAQQQAEQNRKTALDAAQRFESTRQRLVKENERTRSALSVALRAPISSLRPTVAPIDPPPPNLASPCDAGPDYPPGTVTLGRLLDTVAQRESAAAECRNKHAELVKAWPSSK